MLLISDLTCLMLTAECHCKLLRPSPDPTGSTVMQIAPRWTFSTVTVITIKFPPLFLKRMADLNCNIQDDTGAFYGVTSQYESSENMTITCSTKVCSFGKQVVEKVETEYARFENGRFVYRINRSPMCEYMINFIHKLKHLPEKYMMNSVLENFTILLVVTNRDTQETLLCMACVFEVSNSEHGAQHHIYRLV
ncbi:hypothetical protein DV515_00012746 [Chloebia gouldiae]|uniref:YAP binding domain-containing protein n=1 Tax=Chloebia gouldiae TaxID=44316 RepID=A0A3L8S428_CHLGU|nr:hypothetical protein DV515_00012746 [Chloebia gouldiae]